jgi:hypothetical protein
MGRFAGLVVQSMLSNLFGHFGIQSETTTIISRGTFANARVLAWEELGAMF